VQLWWPQGAGKQPRYFVNASLATTAAAAVAEAAPVVVAQTSRLLGFRHVALVTGNDTDAAYVQRAATEEGTELHGMFFRVNGAVIYARGANMIPMDELEGRYTAAAHREVVRSAAAAHINMLRVWGGGVYLPQVWYDTCDELGVLVFHDMMYAQQGHAPTADATQAAELRHNVRRLSHHPSLVLYDGCNECTVDMNASTAIYANFVMTTVAEEDRSRAVCGL
jgi:beta-mannosidase